MRRSEPTFVSFTLKREMLANARPAVSDVQDVQKQARALTGTVTKLLDNFGFIDDSVFFQLSVVKGGDVRVGDKVYCECSYSEHLPFKWNATKVQPTAPRPASGPAPAVATTYLQHRLQQQTTRDDNTNYYSSGSGQVSSVGSGQVSGAQFSQLDLSKAQQAVQAAQQLATLYGQSGRSEFSQLQYTSTPGAAFVSAAPLPFTQQIQQNLLSTQRSTAFKTRWDDRRDDRNDRNDRRKESRRENDVMRKKDEFGRDLRSKERERERDREAVTSSVRRQKRSLSPTSSVSSQSARVKRRYEVVNIPKLTLLKHVLNAYDVRQRYSGGVHVPSDLKEIRINADFGLNLKEMPKPLIYRVVESDKKGAESKKESDKKEGHEKKGAESDKKESEKKEEPEVKKAESEGEKKEESDKEDTEKKAESAEKEAETEKNVEPEKAESVKGSPKAEEKCSETKEKQNYKYGVKVLLLALPSMSEIFERSFGADFDAIQTGSKSYFLHFNKMLSFLVARNSNDGFSLIGGKFNPKVDGFLPESEEPNLVATAIRVVAEQTGMNLSKCGKWRLISTFVFNRDSSVDPTTDHLELTRVYLPDIWSSLDSIYEPLNEKENDFQNQNVLSNDKIFNNNTEIAITECFEATTDGATATVQPDGPVATESASDSNSAMDLSAAPSGGPSASSDPIVDKTASSADSSLNSVSDASHVHVLLSRVNDMKVAELRVELERRGLKLKGGLKKAELVGKLREVLGKLLEDSDVVCDENKTDWWAQKVLQVAKTGEEKESSMEGMEVEAVDTTLEAGVEQQGAVKETHESNENKVEELKEVQSEEKDNEEKEMNGQKEEVKEVAVNGTEEKMEVEENGCSAKRKGEEEEAAVVEKKKRKLSEGCVEVKGSEGLTVITLHEALNHQKYDQFEMAITSEVVREALIHHFAHYILSSLVHNHRNPLSKDQRTALEAKTALPVNYVHLAFSYFDNSRCGYLLAEDLSKLFSNAGFTLSRKSFGNLVNNEDKVTYRELQEPLELLPLHKEVTKKCSGSGRIIERNGTFYDVEHLIDQSESDQKTKVRLSEEVSAQKEQIGQLKEYIEELENRQKKMVLATEKQNDEICELKRERERQRKESDSYKKVLENSYSEIGRVLAKNEKKEKEESQNKDK